MYKFLKPDLEELIRERDSIIKEMEDSGRDMGEATQQSTETWHDNSHFDTAERDFQNSNQRYKTVTEIIEDAKVVVPSEKASHQVEVGSVVTFIDQDGNEETLKIGSYRPGKGSDAIPYNAPKVAPLMGAEVGDVVEGEVGGREVEYEVLKIERWY